MLLHKRKKEPVQENPVASYQVEYCDLKLYVINTFGVSNISNSLFVDNWESLKHSGSLSEEEYLVTMLIDSRCGSKTSDEKLNMFSVMKNIKVSEIDDNRLEVHWVNRFGENESWVEVSESDYGYTIHNSSVA